MIAKCPTCESRYRVDDSKVSPGGTKFKCKKCKNTFTVFREIQHQEEETAVRRAPTTKNCPHCGKPIPFQAVKCRYCREAVDRAAGGFEGQEEQAGEGMGEGEVEHHDPFVPQGGPDADRQDPFASQGGSDADHQDPFVPQGAGGYSGANAFESNDDFGGTSDFGAPSAPGDPSGSGGMYMSQVSVEGKRINPHLFAFPLWGGFFAIMAGAVFAQKNEGLAAVFLITGGVALIYAVIYGLIALYRCWSVIQGPDSRTTPGKAVGFMFIPFFNFYWVFVAIKGLAEDVNAFIMRTGLKEEKISTGLSLAYCILYIIGMVIGFISVAALIIQTILIYQWARFNNSIVRTQ